LKTILIIILLIIGYLIFNQLSKKDENKNISDVPKEKENIISLQDRAKNFLELPIPKGMNYIPDSLDERFIVEYAETGRLELDDQMKEILWITTEELSIVENAPLGSEDAFMNESALILKELLKTI